MEIECNFKIEDFYHVTSIIAYSGVINHAHKKIGNIRFAKIIRLGADFADLDWAIDSQDSDDTKIGYFFDDYGNLKFGKRKYSGNILCRAHLDIEKPFRGLKLSYYIFHKIIHSFGGDCDAVLLWAKPLQFCMHLIDDHKYDDLDQNEDSAYKSLINYYRKFGFKKLTNPPILHERISSHMYLDLFEYRLKESPYGKMPDTLMDTLDITCGITPEPEEDLWTAFKS